MEPISFQFYPSSIKSETADDFIRAMKGFNSTLVQLKGLADFRAGCSESSFNSTLVQLKAARGMTDIEESNSFNSTLVQLKGNIRKNSLKLSS